MISFGKKTTKIAWVSVLVLCEIFSGESMVAQSSLIAEEKKYYTITDLKVPEEIIMEVGGLAFDEEDQLGICTRRGELWVVKDPLSNAPEFKKFASGLHEPLGLAFRNGSYYLAQRGELTKITDSDKNGSADKFESIYTWDLAGNYHEYAYGPLVLDDGSMIITLNLGWVGRGASLSKWSGWMLHIQEDGTMTPFATGLRSPAGMGLNKDGDLFYTENQGDWVGSGRMTHMEKGVFAGHPEGLKWSGEPDSPVTLKMEDIKDEEETTLYEYAQKDDRVRPPSVWFPHTLMGISTSDIEVIPDGFGPFAGQLLVGDQGHSKIMRVYQEKVNGVYQGICFPFVEGFSSGVLRLEWGPEKTLFVGMTNRGWASTGKEPYGVQKVTWTGQVPFEMNTVNVMPDGFVIKFTKPVDRRKSADPEAYTITDFNYRYHHFYGSPAIDQQDRTVFKVDVAQDGMSVRLYVEGLRKGYVNEIKLNGITDNSGNPLLHNTGYYTINQIPEGDVIQYTGHEMKGDEITEEVDLKSSKRITQMPSDWINGPDEELLINAVAGMKYDKIMLTVKAGSRVRLTFNNPDDMMHNLLVVLPGTADEVAEAAIALGLKGEQMGFIPESEYVIAHTNLLRPNSSDIIYFVAPDKPGRYQYVCTFPAHAATMRGILRVTQ